MSEKNSCCGHSIANVEKAESTTRDDSHRQNVRDAYAQVAKASDKGESCGISAGCCGTSDDVAINTLISTRLGYSQEELDRVPSGADMGLGCGNPKRLLRSNPARWWSISAQVVDSIAFLLRMRWGIRAA